MCWKMNDRMDSDIFDAFWAEKGEGQEYSLLVTGYSMRPFLLHNRSCVFIQKKSQVKLRKGDVILFRRDTGKVILHRIVRVCADGSIITNGDAQCWIEAIRSDQVYARVTRICRTSRVFSADNLLYRVFTVTWVRLLPIRPFLFKLWAKLLRRKS